jgi:hypothetical protein
MILEKIDFLDRQLTCLDCGGEFTFTTGEQRYFWAKGLSEPKRCKPCRMLRKRSLVSVWEGWDGSSSAKQCTKSA